MLRGLDLFSGIGGISLALKPWVKTIAYCEIEPYCQAVLLERMQSNDLDFAPIWDDVTTLDRTVLDTEIDIIFGGFPCQDVSVAGKQLGIKSDTRSGLFFHIMRLVRQYRPQYIFLENVAAICTNGLDTVLREIAEAGYDAKWCCVSASEAGAPHKRDRWWLLAYTNTTRLPETWTKFKATGFAGNGAKALAYSASVGMEGLRSDGEQKSDLNEQKALSLCSGQRWPARPNEPQDEWEPPRIVANSKHIRRQSGEIERCFAETICDRSQGQITSRESTRVCASGVSSASERVQNSGDDGTQPRLGGNVDGVSYRVDRIKALGNSVVPQAARKAFEMLMFEQNAIADDLNR